MAEQGRSPHDVTTVLPDKRAATSDAATVLALTIAHHPDVSRVGERALLHGLADGASARLSRLVPKFAATDESESRPLALSHLSRRPVFIERDARGTVWLMVDGDAVQLYADGVRCQDRQALTADAIGRGVVLELSDCVALILHEVACDDAAVRDGDLGLVGVSEAIQRVRERVCRVAPHQLTILLRGESGTGKELVAHAIHVTSGRAAGSFVSVNMAAVAPSTAAASLFGHTRGAFTGALRASRGYFGEADNGTLFLDEIADTPGEIQPALLRALEGGEVQPLGEERTRKVDVRLVAATDLNLEQAVADGHFRHALMQRISGYVISLPPLRERTGDVGVLLAHFLREELAKMGALERLVPPENNARPWLPCWLMAAAARATWPGNVRQLRNVAQQLSIDWGDRDEIPRDPEVEALFLPARKPVASDSVTPAPKTRRRLDDINEAELVEALRRNQWRPAPTAVSLGISRTSLYALIAKSPSIRKASDLRVAEIEAALRAAAGDIAGAAQALCVSEQGLKRQLRELGITP